MQQIVDNGDFIYIGPYYVVHKSGAICPYLHKYHVTLKGYGIKDKPINGISPMGNVIRKIRDNYIIIGFEWNRRLLTKHLVYAFETCSDKKFIDADISSGGELTTIYENSKYYIIKTGDRPEYTIKISNDSLRFRTIIRAIEGKYVMYNLATDQLIIGDELSSITINDIVKITDNFVVSHADTILGRSPLCTIPHIYGDKTSISVYLLDAFISRPTGKKTKPAPREL